MDLIVVFIHWHPLAHISTTQTSRCRSQINLDPKPTDSRIVDPVKRIRREAGVHPSDPMKKPPRYEGFFMFFLTENLFDVG